MNVGVLFPQTEIGSDPAAIRDFVQAAENLGYSHLIVYEHVLGADTRHHQNWSGLYTSKDTFHEPMVLFGYLAGITTRLELVTAVLILGQRQTALVAKQAAEVDLLSGGRLRLGIGVGWNPVEYEALGENFHDRGRRTEEQISLLRSLWTEDVVNFRGALSPGNSCRHQPSTGAASHTHMDRCRGMGQPSPQRPGSAAYRPPRRWVFRRIPT